SVTNFIMACDEAIIVLTPEPTAIMDAYSLIKYLYNQDYRDKVGIVINQINSRKEGTDVASRMKNVIRKYLSMDIEVLGFIPYDRYVKQSVKEQTPFIIQYPNSKAVQALKDIAGKMLDKAEESEGRGMKSFFYRVVGIFGGE
ncbi:MAG: MinD/ParA family ATP-binding protein, partial [Halanaerobiaceae bacterium]